MQPDPSSHPIERLIEWTGERCVPWTGDLQVVYEHYHRYLLARLLVQGKRVLDLASGEGYGSALLAGKAAQVVALEIDPDSVAHSRETYVLDNLEFVEGSMLDLSRLAAASFDVVTCFEALEHVTEHDELVAQVRRVLAPGGIFLTSTPDRLVYTEELHQHNPYHVRELSLAEFKDLLGTRFTNVRYWGQAVAVGSLIQPVDDDQPGGSNVFALGREGEDWVDRGVYASTYYLAAASDQELPPLPGQSVLVDVEFELVRNAQRAASERADAAAQLAEVRAAHAVLADHLATLDAREEQARKELASREEQARKELDALEQTRAERDCALASALEAQDAALGAQRELAAIRGSRAHAMADGYYRFVERLAPTGTRRRAVFRRLTRG